MVPPPVHDYADIKDNKPKDPRKINSHPHRLSNKQSQKSIESAFVPPNVHQSVESAFVPPLTANQSPERDSIESVIVNRRNNTITMSDKSFVVEPKALDIHKDD